MHGVLPYGQLKGHLSVSSQNAGAGQLCNQVLSVMQQRVSSTKGHASPEQFDDESRNLGRFWPCIACWAMDTGLADWGDALATAKCELEAQALESAE